MQRTNSPPRHYVTSTYTRPYTLISIFLYYANFNVLEAHFFCFFVDVNLQEQAVVWIQLVLENHLPTETTILRNKTGSPPIRQVQQGLEPSRIVSQLGRLRQFGIQATISSDSFTTGSFNAETWSSSLVIVLVANYCADEVMAV